MKLMALEELAHQKLLISQQIQYLGDLDKSKIIPGDHAHLLTLYKPQFFWLKL
jgi:hypothetical protein